MKIKETVERECCQNKDRIRYRGVQHNPQQIYYFCKYCGQIWYWTTELDAAGDVSDCLRKVII